VTNDVVCLKYKTDQQSDLRNMEKLNNLFLRLMSSKKVEGAVEEEAKDAESAAAAAAAGAAGQAQGGPQPAASPGGADRKRKKARN
jgi:signal recognition particle subunit SRP9